MASLNTAPMEVFVRLSVNLELIDEAHLSSANSAFRALLTTSIFQTIRFSNKTQADGLLLATNKYGHHTSTLHFMGHASRHDDDQGEREFPKPVLSSAASALLRSQHTPRLHAVELRCAFDFFGGDDELVWDDDSQQARQVFDTIESEEFIRKFEDDRVWRALMSEAWPALVTNRPATRLSLSAFVLKSTTTTHR